MNFKLLAILMLLLTNMCNAEGWYEVGNVTRLHTGHGNTTSVTGAIYFTTITQISNDNCASNAGYTFDENNPNSDRIYALILSAYVSKIPVSIFVTNECLGGRPKVDAVQYKDSGVPF